MPSETVPAGLAILDAPDIDSVEERNRTLAAQLLAAADLWLFVTSAARYADQVPWEFLRKAAERSAAVAIVLDRTPPEAVETVSTHLARMLAVPRAQGLAALHRHRGRRHRGGPAAPGVGRRHPRLARVAGRRRRRALGRGPADPRGRRSARCRGVRTRSPTPRPSRSTPYAACARTSTSPTTRRWPRSPRRPPTAPCCAARCSPAGRSSSAPASCSSRWRPGSAGCATGSSTRSRASRSRPSGSPWRSSPAWRP